MLPQRDAVGRLARREFPFITEQLAYRFRDVHDHLVRLSDEAMFFQDRISGILDAHLSAVSNQLNSVMKVLTLISTIFPPLTVLTGMYGMNVTLPHMPGGDGWQFWWVVGIMVALSAGWIRISEAGAGSEMGRDSRSSPPPRQSDRRRRGGRAAGVGGQGAGRERARCGRDRGSRSPIELGGKKLIRVEDDGEGMDAGGRAARRRAACHEQDQGPTTSARFARSGSAARRCRASRRCRIS